jgi:plastocyanin
VPRRLAPALLTTVAVLSLASCAGGGGDATNATPVKGVDTVVAKDMKFLPPVIEVTAGTQVTWTFDDRGVPHNVKAEGFNSPTVTSGTFVHRFDRPGSYPYRCDLHAKMTGRVEVK